MTPEDAALEARDNLRDELTVIHGGGLVSDGADQIVADLFSCPVEQVADLCELSERAHNVRHELANWPADQDQVDGLWKAAQEFLGVYRKQNEWDPSELTALAVVVDGMEDTARRTVYGWPS